MKGTKKIKPPKIDFDFETMKWKNVTLSQIQIWQELYKGIDVMRIVGKDIPCAIDRQVDRIDGKIIIKGWVQGKTDWKRTITNWLKREQAKLQGVI